MKIIYLYRKYNKNEISIEKLFGYLIQKIKINKIEVLKIENPFGSGIFNLFRSIFFFRNKIKKTDVVHITGQIHFAAIALKTKKIIITVHDLGLYRDLTRFRSFIFKLFWIYLPFKKASYIVAISEKTKNEIIGIMPSVAHKIVVIPNCLTIEIGGDLSIDYSKHNSILIVGTRTNKNLMRSLKALEGLDVEVLIIGELTEEVREILENYRIKFNNKTNVSEENLFQYYRESNILLFPSIYEGFGLPILEAQASNTIVITSNISPMNEISGNSAFLVDPFSKISIRKAVIKALNLTDFERRELTSKGRENVKKYQSSYVSKEYMKLYYNLQTIKS
ncbi:MULTISPECIES: glycosyltransferase family 4 protein [unclassified Empedobacter]|uniref:glycosyltransferase family 4 protein n=1 Tax=unclassified Empedobacter TaxID=2643773 RepID=UPI0025BCA7BA|nr:MULTISPECIES: glycosyltransferase family 1 protein [unclassified Empedobacter]